MNPLKKQNIIRDLINKNKTIDEIWNIIWKMYST